MSESFNVGDAYITLRIKQEQLEKDNRQLKQSLENQEAQLQRVADKAEDAGDRLDNAFGDKLVQMAARAVAAMGTVELGLGAINVATDVFEGNIEGAAEAVKRLPAGIGPVAQQFETLLGTLTGITTETEAWEQATKNLTQAMSQRFQTSLDNLRAEEDAILTRLKIEQRIAVLQSGGSDAAARLKQQFDAQNRINEAKRAAIELDRQAQELSFGAEGDKFSAREVEIAELEEQIKEREGRVKGITNPFGINQTTVENFKDATVALERQRDSLVGLQEAYLARIKSLQDEADLIRSDIPVLEKLAAVEKERLEQGIEERKTEEQKREAEERIREAEREAQQKLRAAEREFEDRKRMAREAHDEEVRLMRETAAEQKRIRDQRISESSRTINLLSSIVQKELRLQGRDLEAELDQIIQNARDQAENATTGEQRGLINQNRDLDIEAAIRRAEQGLESSSSQASVTSLSAAIGNLQSAALQREDPSVAQRREQIAIARRMQETLEKIEQKADEADTPSAVGR